MQDFDTRPEAPAEAAQCHLKGSLSPDQAKEMDFSQKLLPELKASRESKEGKRGLLAILGGLQLHGRELPLVESLSVQWAGGWGARHPNIPTELQMPQDLQQPYNVLLPGSKLLILVLCLNIQSEVESCPGACVCYSEPKITISCQQQGLTAIPTEIPIQSQRIFLHNNKITLVRSTSFTSCRNMTILWIHSNNISLIEPGAFYGLSKLEELDLSDNTNLKSINPVTFRGLVHLHTLHLDRCGLLELSTGLFRGLFSLQYLYLQDNNLQNLLDDTFIDLANLTYLFLHGNKIKSLSENVFRGLINLDRLLLHQNRVSLVHRRSFHDLGKVMTLYLFNNNLTVLTGETMAPLVSLQYLRLNGNQWICDCQARSLWNWFRQFKGSSSELECHLPPHLAGRDLKRLQSSDLDGCVDSFNQIRTSVFSTKTRSGKLPTGNPPLSSHDGSVKCCQPEMDKSFIYEAKGKSGPSHSSRPSSNNPLKDKENMSKTKYIETDRSKNSSNKQINDSPFGTFPSIVDPPMTKLKPEFLEPIEPSTVPTKKRQGCSKKNKSKAQCRLTQQGNSSTLQLSLSLLIPPLTSEGHLKDILLKKGVQWAAGIPVGGLKSERVSSDLGDEEKQILTTESKLIGGIKIKMDSSAHSIHQLNPHNSLWAPNQSPTQLTRNYCTEAKLFQSPQGT
ncbi:Reticulon-4 receptor [Aix galericulata]|nr:Reticulon-4 receptor [Aix galericulata]